MPGLFGDRFLKRFASSLKTRRKSSLSKDEEQKPESNEEKIGGSDGQETGEFGKKEAAGLEKMDKNDRIEK